jgi:2-polyprenyl-3-methyl-5-hydroxy-6-metoxy-1,4-benzoquinol methylase
MYTISRCPICEGQTFIPKFTCKDWTVSHETFALISCASCNLQITNPRPDDDQLGKYYLSTDYISHSNQSKSFTDKLYKLARYFTLKWKLSLVKEFSTNPKEKINLLDYGCGTGDFLKACYDDGLKLSGVEPSDIARTKAISQVGQKIYYDLSEVTSYNIITLWHVLEHIPDLTQTLECIINKLEKNGTIIIAVPNHLSFDAHHYKNHWAGYDVPRHLWHFSQQNMKELLIKNNLTLVKIYPMKLDSFYVSMLSEKYLQGKSFSLASIFKAFIIGLRSNYSAKKQNQYSSLIYIARKK